MNPSAAELDATIYSPFVSECIPTSQRVFFDKFSCPFDLITHQNKATTGKKPFLDLLSSFPIYRPRRYICYEIVKIEYI